MEQSYEWQFFRAGDVDQVVIRTGQDIAHIGELDKSSGWPWPARPEESSSTAQRWI